MKPIFLGKIENGKLIISDQENFDLWCGNFEGKTIDLTIEKHKTNRTIQQNKYLWGVVYKLISDELGYNPEEVNDLMKTMFLKKHLTVKNTPYLVIGSSKDLSTGAFSDYVEKIKRWASQELNIVIPDAEKIEE